MKSLAMIGCGERSLVSIARTPRLDGLALISLILMWATGLLLDAGVRVVLTFVLPVAAMVWLSPVIFYAGLFALMMWMFSYIVRARARASAAGVETLGTACTSA